MSKNKSKSKDWLRRHTNDPYVKRAQQERYRSRAAYKLIEIDHSSNLIGQRTVVIDLGSAPGAWSQYIVRKTDFCGQVVAIDLLPMEPIEGVTFIQGDFLNQESQLLLRGALEGKQVDLVISDMAPNITGVRSIDEANFEELLSEVLKFCQHCLKPSGTLLTKVFEGHGAQSFRREVKRSFAHGQVKKPNASRANSREYYYLASGFKG